MKQPFHPQEDHQFPIADLAVQCKFMTVQQSKEAEKLLHQENKRGRALSFEDIVTIYGLITPGQLKFLYMLKAHLKEQTLDQRFGKIAVDNGFVSEEDIKKALAIQAAEFKKTKITCKIGDLLVEAGKLTLQQRDLILIKQHRFKRKKIQNILDMRFGAIAVKKKFTTIDAINEALKQQIQYFREEKVNKKLGDILIENGAITQEQLEEILGEQLRITKLQQKIDQEVEKELQACLTLEWSKDKMKLFIVKKKKTPERASATHVRNWLLKNKVIYGIYDSLITEMLNAEPVKGNPQKYKVAEGLPPIPGRAAVVEYFVTVQQEGGAVQGKSIRRSIPNDQGAVTHVKRGDLIARKRSMISGKSGKDVRGRSIPPPESKNIDLWSGNGVFSKDGGYYAEVPGIPKLSKKGTLSIVNELTFKGDMQPGAGASTLYEDVKVTGAILDGCVVKCNNLLANEIKAAEIDTRGDIQVEKGISGAVLRAIGDMDVQNDIEHSEIKDHGNIKAKFMSNTKVISYGDIELRKGLDDSSIVTSGALRVKEKITGSRIMAQKGIYAKDILCAKGKVCELRVGVDANAKLRIDEIQEEIRQKNIDLKDSQQILKRQMEKQEKLIEEIAQVVQKEENDIREQKYVKERIEECKKENRMVEMKQFDEALEVLGQKIKAAEKVAALHVEQQEELAEYIIKVKKDIENQEAAIKECNQNIESLSNEEGQPVVEVTGVIEKGTVIRGVFSQIKLDEDHQFVRIEEVKGSGFDWKFQISALK